MLSVLFALAAAAQPVPAFNPEAACRLAEADRVPTGKVYSVRGTYQSDGMHGSMLELPKCDRSFSPRLVGDASAAVTAWHEAYRTKCGNWLFGDYIRGVFTGTFAQRKSEFLGEPIMLDVFEISHIETGDLDIPSISCEGAVTKPH